MADYKISQLTPVTPTSDDLLEVSHTTDSGVTYNTGSVSVDTLSSAVADNITAADIEYSSGVSVADKIDELLTPVDISSGISRTGLMDNLSIEAYTIGNLVFVSFTCHVSAATSATGSVLLTGLPIPKVEKQIYTISNLGNKVTQLGLMINGSIQTNYSDAATVANGAYLMCDFSYIKQ